QSTILITSPCRNSLLNLDLIAHRCRGYLQPQRNGRGIDHSQECLVNTVVRIAKHEQAIDEWRSFFEDLQPFSGDGPFGIGEARDVPTWLHIVAHEAATNRISHLREHDRDL